MTKAGPDTIRFAGAKLGRHRHVCAFFNGAESSFEVLAPFICHSFLCNHRAVHLVRADKRESHLARLRCAGIDTEASQRSGQLEVLSTVEAYLHDGRFDKDRMVEAFTAKASGNKDARYPLSRIVCDMGWATEAPGYLEDLIDFESRVNDLWSQHDDVVIRVYDLAKFGGDTIVDILRTHPLVVIGGILRENPFFVPPLQFIKESRERRSKKEEQSVAAE